MAINLYPPQRENVEKLKLALSKHDCVGIWSATGTGKTLVALTVAKEMNLKPLICCPLAAFATWKYWAEELEVPLIGVVNQEKLKTGKTPWVTLRVEGKQKRFSWTLNPNTEMLIFDEIHRGLSGTASQAGAMAAMTRVQKIKTQLLSATPFTSPLNLRSVGFLFRMHNYSASSFYDFCRRHGCRASRFHRGLEFDHASRLSRVHLQRIAEFLADRTVRLTTDDLAEYFGESIVEPTLINLAERDRAEIDAAYAAMADEVKKKEHSNPIVTLLRARQRAELLSIEAVADMVENSVNEGLSVFVAQSFRESVVQMEAALRKRGISDLSILTGDSNADHRIEAVDAFQMDRNRVFLATTAAGGLSVSLHRLREGGRPRTSIIRVSYSVSELAQALGRIYRVGMLDKTVVQRLPLVAGTPEERIYVRLQHKLRNMKTMVDDDLI